MITVRIWGGLGNQMFQYAMGYAVAHKRGEDLKLDTTFFYKKHNSRQTERTLDLFRLPIDYKEDNKDLGIAISFIKHPYINHVIRKVLPMMFPVGKYVYVKEHKLEYNPQIQSISKKNIYFDGYWHSERYFKEIRSEIIRQFVYSNDKIDIAYRNISLNDSCETVAVHIRRGDYITQNNPNARGVDYYMEAINVLQRQLVNPRFCFFSDDLEWVRSNFCNLDNIVIANENKSLTDIEELQLMTKCHHQIISNSSFSWWAAWLNQNKKKIIVVPKVWLKKKDMMLDEWIKI